MLPVLPWWENWMICGRLSTRGGVRTVTVQPHRQPQGSHTHTHTWRGDKGCHDDPLVTVATQLFVLTKRWFSPSGPRSPCVSIGSISLRVCIYLRSQRETSRMFQVSQFGFNASLHPFFLIHSSGSDFFISNGFLFSVSLCVFFFVSFWLGL